MPKHRCFFISVTSIEVIFIIENILYNNEYMYIQFLLIKNCFHMIYLLSSYMWFLQFFLYLVIVSSKQYNIQKQSLVLCLADKKNVDKQHLPTATN